MFKAYMTFALMALVLLGVATTSAEAKTNKKKSRTKTSLVKEDSKNEKKKKKLKNKKNKKARVSKYRRYKRSGTGPDLRALTTEQPNTEYVQTPDNGVNPVEMKAEL